MFILQIFRISESDASVFEDRHGVWQIFRCGLRWEITCQSVMRTLGESVILGLRLPPLHQFVLAVSVYQCHHRGTDRDRW